MNIVLAQVNFHVGNFNANFEKIKTNVQEAKNNGADLIVFPELALTGYPARDFLEFDSFIDNVEHYLGKIQTLSSEIAIIIGAPRRNKGEGKALFNSAYFFNDRILIGIQDKYLLPTYDIFDEVRYFEKAQDFQLFELKGKTFAITICEDIWNVGENAIYHESPLDKYPQSFDFVINIAASPFDFNQMKKRKEVLTANIKKYQAPFYYCNHSGAQTELIFDGGSIALDANCNVIGFGNQFCESLTTVKDSCDSILEWTISGKYEQIESALVLGIKDYFSKLGFKKAVIGLSGGIDSALTFALTCKAIGSENVHGILMPSEYSSDHSIKDAEDLVNNLNASSNTVSIASIFEEYKQTLKPIFGNLPEDLTEENLQARIRGVLLMAYSNKKGNIVLNTSNKSEAAVGYGTLYGDMCGGLSVLGDLYKTEVFELSKHINRDAEIIPWNTITKPPSAELRPDQKDTDSLPEYDELDPILFEYIENRKGVQEIVDLGYDENLVNRIIKLVNINEYKRYQTAPTLRVSRKAFGMGRRLPIAAKFEL